jgi:hypothetical protein
MIQLQYDLFEDTEEVLLREIQETKNRCENLRKALFARNNELSKLHVELNHRVEILEKVICAGKSQS